ncbi:MAG: 6-phosphogluconolactonase [Planctomycetota bacterium]|nr:6-phosphogluconolactonase [Planctomycetota bacterium]
MGRSNSDRDESYPLEGGARPTGPPLPGIVDVADRGEDVLDLVTADILAQALDCTHRYGSFHLAISGSEGLEPLCRRMMFDPDLRRFPWDRTHLWVADDRCVPRNDPLSCYWRLRETLILPAGIPLPQVHPIPSTDEMADEIMEGRLRDEIDNRSHGAGHLDCVVLDVGEDGRVGGLFPGSEAVLEPTRRARFTNNDQDAYPHWVSLTLPAINAARMIAVLVQGSRTGQAIRQAITSTPAVIDFPAVGLRGDAGVLKWYLDLDAAHCAV